MLSWKEILIRLVLASVFGALIGLERERKDWTAGMRTHMMVCVGSALIMMVSAFGFGDVLGGEHIVLDPSRVAAQVISGIGFIGAGTILFLKQGTIRGLTTATGLWTVAGIGLATGGGMYFAAGAATLIAIIILWALQPFEKRYSERFKHRTLRVITTSSATSSQILRQVLEHPAITIQNFSLDKTDADYVLEIKFANTATEELTHFISRLHNDTAIKELYWNPGT